MWNVLHVMGIGLCRIALVAVFLYVYVTTTNALTIRLRRWSWYHWLDTTVGPWLAAAGLLWVIGHLLYWLGQA